MRLESVSVIALLAIGSGIAYAWWVTRRRTRGASLERDGVAGRATVTALTHEAGGVVRIAYRFRHPFAGTSHEGSGALPTGAVPPAIGEEVEIAYVPDEPDRSCLAVQITRP